MTPQLALTSLTNTEYRAKICRVSLQRRCASNGKNSSSDQHFLRLLHVLWEAKRQNGLPAREKNIFLKNSDNYGINSFSFSRCKSLVKKGAFWRTPHGHQGYHYWMPRDEHNLFLMMALMLCAWQFHKKPLPNILTASILHHIKKHKLEQQSFGGDCTLELNVSCFICLFFPSIIPPIYLLDIHRKSIEYEHFWPRQMKTNSEGEVA